MLNKKKWVAFHGALYLTSFKLNGPWVSDKHSGSFLGLHAHFSNQFSYLPFPFFFLLWGGRYVSITFLFIPSSSSFTTLLSFPTCLSFPPVLSFSPNLSLSLWVGGFCSSQSFTTSIKWHKTSMYRSFCRVVNINFILSFPTYMFNVPLFSSMIVSSMHKKCLRTMIGTWGSSLISMMMKLMGI